MPLFSIIIPAYNYGHFLRHAVESVLIQEDADYDIIIIDDGSTDNTCAIAEQYCISHPGKIRYVYQSNQGIAAARNTGVRHAGGDFLLFLDADDRLLPDALTRFRNLLLQNSSLDAAFGSHVSVGFDGTVRQRSLKPLSNNSQINFKRYLRKQLGTLYSQASIIRRTVFSQLKYPENVFHSQDTVLFAQLLATRRCISFPEPVVAVYKHADSLRRNVKNVVDVNAVDALFDPDILPAQLMRMRSEYLAKYYLLQFRILYSAGDYAEARKRYQLAIRSFPRYLLRLSSLRKYLRIIFKK